MLGTKLKSMIFSAGLILVLALQACSSATATAPAVSPPVPTREQIPTLTATSDAISVSATPTSRPVPTETLLPTETPPTVTITAVNGNLAIRKGPNVAFDAIAALHDGETAQAVARSILDGWVEIPIPGSPDELGWVSTQTSYAAVDGDVLGLPMIRTVEWPTGAYLRNCTSHEMLVQPGDTRLPALNDAPNNRVWFPPGLYTVYDQEVDGHPEVLHVQLWPQYSIDVSEDGNGTKSGCP